MGTRQEIVSKSDYASEPAIYSSVAVPNAGEKFSDEDLHARFNVPAWGGIRVSRDKKCIVLVDLVVRSGYEDVDHGRTVSYMGQNSDREGAQNQEMSADGFPTIPSKTEPANPDRRRMQAASNNLVLSRSKMEGYTVLYFTREWGVDDLRFDSRVECDSHRFVVEERDDRPPRVVIKFELRRVERTPGAAAGGAGPAAASRGAHRGETGGVPGVSGPVGHAAGMPGSARRAIGGPTQAQSPSVAPRSAERHAALLLPCEAQARLELDDSAGSFMRDAIARGGYRAALHYYASDEAKKSVTPSSAMRSTPPIISHGSDEARESDTPWHRLSMQGWLLGRLGLYGQMKGWLEDASAWPDFDDILNAADQVQHLPYKTPAAWLRTPAPAPLRADRIMTLEPAAPACRDIGSVPDYVWTAMLILDAVGPICSHAGLGAAAFLVAAGADKQARGAARRGGGMYDPRRGARLHGAPEECHRWIIADMDFDPRPPNEPHYYYDLTDEGRKALVDARAAGAPWPKATEAAAAGLRGMSLPDLLEAACGFSGPVPGLDKMKSELGRLVDAWQVQNSGGSVPPVDAEDRVLVDLGSTAKWSENGETAGSSLDYFLYLTTIIRSIRAVACEADPSTRAEDAVLRTLIAAIQGLCRKHAGEVTATVSSPGLPTGPARGKETGEGDEAPQQPPYADVTPAMISDMYYCLAEYCRSRGLAADPCSLPLYEALTEDERAAAVRVLADDSLFHHGAD